LAAFLGLVGKELNKQHNPYVQARKLSNVIYACAKLRQQPQADELLLLLEAFLHPDVLAPAAPQAIANVVWSLGLLCVSRGWEAVVSQELLQQLLAPELLIMLAKRGTSQAVANLLVGLGRMCTGPSPLLSTAAAQGYAGQLLSGVRLNRLSSWAPQHIDNTMWALGELQSKDTEFIRAAVAAAPVWLPQCSKQSFNQALSACVQLHYRDEHFMELLLQRGKQMLQPDRRRRGRPLPEADMASVAAMCSLTVAQLDMRGLAGPAR
jgi:hypothetical protein